MDEEGSTEQEESRAGCAWALVALPFQLLLGLLRLTAFVVAYAVGALAGGAVGAALVGWMGVGAAVLGGVAGAAVVPVALTVGVLAWLTPAAVRVVSEGGDPEIERVLPTRLDAVAFAVGAGGAALALGFGWSVMLSADPLGPMLGFATIVLAAAAGIVLTGGRRVAEIWILLIPALLT